MAKKHKYKEMYRKFVDYQQQLHEENQKRIRIGLKVNVLLPLLFLILSFAISEGKLIFLIFLLKYVNGIFLILWIISLFGIAFYLVHVEYSDYKMMEQLKAFGIEGEDEEEDIQLIGESVMQVGSNINEKLDYADDLIEGEKQRIGAQMEERKERLREKVVDKIRAEKEEKRGLGK